MKCYDWAIYRQREMTVELISNPYPKSVDVGEEAVMVRVVPGDPLSMIEVDVSDLVLIDRDSHPCWINRKMFNVDPTIYMIGLDVRASLPEFIRLVLAKLPPIPDPRDLKDLYRGIEELYNFGYTLLDAVEHMRCREDVDPELDEETALKRMKAVDSKYKKAWEKKYGPVSS